MRRILYGFEVIIISCTNLRGMQMSKKWKRKRKFEWCLKMKQKILGVIKVSGLCRLCYGSKDPRGLKKYPADLTEFLENLWGLLC